MKTVFVTQKIPETGLEMLRSKGYGVDVSPNDGILTKEELLKALKSKQYDAVVTLLTNQIDSEVFDAVPSAKIFANYAVGFNNIDIDEAKKRGIMVTNTPGALTEAVAVHTVALMLDTIRRVSEGDRYLRAGSFKGWEPLGFLGMDLKEKVLGLVGAGRIGGRVAEIMKVGFGMNIIYHDIKQNTDLDKKLGAKYYVNLDELLKISDVVSIHVSLNDSTKHLIDSEKLALMKTTSYIINTSRGLVIDENALVMALKFSKIAGAGMDVFENEPLLSPGLPLLQNVVITPHIASATTEARNEMSQMVAQNIIDFFESGTPRNVVNG